MKTQFIQNFLDANKFITEIYSTKSTYIRKLERSQINKFGFHYKKKRRK